YLARDVGELPTGVHGRVRVLGAGSLGGSGVDQLVQFRVHGSGAGQNADQFGPGLFVQVRDRVRDLLRRAHGNDAGAGVVGGRCGAVLGEAELGAGDGGELAAADLPGRLGRVRLEDAAAEGVAADVAGADSLQHPVGQLGLVEPRHGAQALAVGADVHRGSDRYRPELAGRAVK